MRWGEFAALVALAALPLMLAGGPVTLLKTLTRRLLRVLWPAKVISRSLYWDDIPEGPLMEDKDSIKYNSGQCLESTLLKLLARDQKDNWRAKKRVLKPDDLELNTEYVRTDLIAMAAFALACHSGNISSFEASDFPFELEKVGRTMTAHCTLRLAFLGAGAGITKDDMMHLLEDYPPFYRGSIELPSGTILRNPIRDEKDITRAGWTVFLGLCFHEHGRDGTKYLKSSRLHTMAIFPQDAMYGYWKSTTIIDSVERFGHNLQKIHKMFPNDDLVKRSIGLYDIIVNRTKFTHQYWGIPSYVLDGAADFLGSGSNDRFWWNSPREHASMLDELQ